LIANEAPVIAPDIEVTSDELRITDVDIPVEIKSDYAIQVQVNNDLNWVDVRQL